jgi:hypothetical protein
MFNDQLSYSIGEIEQRTGLNKKILDQVICLLLKVKLLVLDEENTPGSSSTNVNTQSLPPQSSTNTIPSSSTQQTATSSTSSSTQISPSNRTNTDTAALGTSYEPTQRVKLFTEYRNKRQRVNINVPLRTEQKIEKESTSKAVDDDRKLEIQCCIVRVMKARKRLDHNALITETIEQLRHRFKPKVNLIKKGIDMLIEKEYMNRAEDDNGVYEYLA